jgi:tol-pal system protein YbgF
VTSRRGGGRLVALAGAVAVLAGCAVEPASPLLREDLVRLRADVARLGQETQNSRAALLAEVQAADRRSTRAATDLQREMARLSTRLDELGRESAQVQGRLDELRRQVDALALQLDAADPPPVRGGGAPPPAPATSRGGAPRPAPPASQAGELYQTAYRDYTRGNYNLAIAAFQEFIRLYPGTELAEKAQFWIGESHFSLARGHQQRGAPDQAVQEFERAVQEFRKMVAAHPRGEQVPTALYKEALALTELGQLRQAETRLQLLVEQFPSTEEAAKARDELARLRRR